MPVVALVRAALLDVWQLGFPDSFKKHVGMTIEEFYIQFTEFMRQGSVDDPPPPGFFPDKPLSELADSHFDITVFHAW